MTIASLRDKDTAGGTILHGAACHVTVDGLVMSLLGDPVAGHGKSPHSSPTMVQASEFVTVNGIGQVYQGCAASCGHTATGSSHVYLRE